MLRAGTKLKDIPLPPIQLEENKKVVIYGTGDVAERYYDKISESYGSDKVAFFLDGQIVRTEFCGKKVFRPEEISAEEGNKYLYLLGSFGSVSLMKQRLLKNGIREKLILPTMDRCNVELLYQMEGAIKKVAIYPPVFDWTEKEELIEMINFYAIPGGDLEGEFVIFSDEEKKINSHFSVINSTHNPIHYQDYDVVLVWNPSTLYDVCIKDHPRVFCFNPDVIPHLESKVLHCISMKMLKREQLEEYRLLSKESFSGFREDHKEINKAYAFGSGPSLKQYMNTISSNELKDGIRIVCNEFCENPKLMSVIQPDLYVLWDYGYFGQRLESVLKNVITYICEHDCKLLVPNTVVRMICKRYPIESNKIIGLSPYGKEICFPTEEKMEVVRTDSVMTAFILPIASSLTDNIYIVGCDGMKEEGDWGHSEDLKGKSIDYANAVAGRMGKVVLDAKYKGICKYYDTFFDFAEARGKSYISITQSYIPALRKRSKETL